MAGAVAQQTGAVAQQTRAVAQQNRAVAQQTGASTQQSDAIAPQTGTVTHQTGAIIQQTGAVTQQTGPITQQTGAGAQQTGTITQQTGTVTQQTGPITQQAGANETSAGSGEDSGSGNGTRPKEGQSNSIIVNELLCFIQNKIDVMARDLLIQLCVEFYSTQVIAQSKRLLFDSVTTKFRYSRKKGDSKDRENVSDITRVFLELDTSSTVTFVAANLSKLPPLSVNNFDVLSVVREVEALKTSMDRVLGNQAVMADLLCEQMKSEASRSRQENVNLPLGGNMQQTGKSHTPMQTTNESFVPKDYTKAEVGNQSYPHNLDSDYETRSEASIEPSTWSSDSESDSNMNLSHSSQWPGLEPPKKDMKDESHPFRKQKGKRHYRSQQRSHDDRCSDSTGYSTGYQNNRAKEDTASRSRKYGNGIIGRGQSIGLKAAKPARRQQKQKTNVQVTGVFITRLDPRTSSREVEHNVQKHTGLKIRAEKMRCKYPESYSSFYVRGDKKVRDMLIDADLWPQNTLVKPFEEK